MKNKLLFVAFLFAAAGAFAQGADRKSDVDNPAATDAGKAQTDQNRANQLSDVNTPKTGQSSDAEQTGANQGARSHANADQAVDYQPETQKAAGWLVFGGVGIALIAFIVYLRNRSVTVGGPRP